MIKGDISHILKLFGCLAIRSGTDGDSMERPCQFVLPLHEAYRALQLLITIYVIHVSTSVFAEEHAAAALEHANAAVVHDEAGQTAIFIEHAKTALEHVLAASLVAKGLPKNHLNAAVTELQESIDPANLGHIGSATIYMLKQL